MPTPRQLTVGEIFAGAGGLGLGFILANHSNIIYNPVFAVDNDPNSVQTYTHNFRWLAENAPNILSKAPRVFEEDAETINVSALLRKVGLKPGELDILLGGPPCQGFSTSNRRAKEQSKSERNRLIKIFFDRLGDISPKMFLLENVQGVKWTKATREMSLSQSQTLFDDLPSSPSTVQEYAIYKAKELGYKVWWRTLDAVNYGVPQHRARFFLFGVKESLLDDNQPIELPIDKYIAKNVTVEEAIGDLPHLENGGAWDGTSYHASSSDYVRLMRRFISSNELLDHVTTNHAPYVIERYKKIPQGSNWMAIRQEMDNYSDVDNTHSNIYRRLQTAKPAHTISHYRKSMVIHPIQHRGLSLREACRLQSFPDWFQFQGPMDKKQQQLANAVPPLMASTVAAAIADFWGQAILKSHSKILATA